MFCIIVEPLVCWMLQYAVNRCDLIRRLKLSQSMSGSCKLSHNELQMDRPATEKARRPNRLGQYTAVRHDVNDWQTISCLPWMMCSHV